MRIQNIVSGIVLGSVALGLSATSAWADTSTYNKYTNTNIYGGYTETTVDASVNSTSVQRTLETSTKIEAIADLGDTNIANVSVSGTVGGDINFKANAHSSNNRPVDPVATVYVSNVEQTTVTRTTELADIDTFSSNRFSGNTYEHEVGTRNN